MRAAEVVTLTGPLDVVVNDVPEPTPEPDDVLVEVHSVGDAFPDLLLSRGEYQMKPEPPFNLGVDFAGEVLDPGSSDLVVGAARRGCRRLGQRGRAGGLAEGLDLPAARRLRTTRARRCR